MKTDIEQMIDHFHEVKKLGYVKSIRKGDTGIGQTFEHYVGVIENNIQEPDLFGFEIKSHRELSNSYITLFTLRPKILFTNNLLKKDETPKYLRDTFGIVNEQNPLIKKLHTSIFADRKNCYEGKYSFKLNVNRELELISIEVYDSITGKLIDDSRGYTFEYLKSGFDKLNNLFFVNANVDIRNRTEYFNYTTATIYTDASFETFLNLLENGQVMYDIRIGSYKSGKNIGKVHDHGCAFRLRSKDIIELYQKKKDIE